MRSENGLTGGIGLVASPSASVRRWFPATAGTAALALGALTATRRGKELDERAYKRLNDVGGPLADGFFKGVTELGSLWASLGAAATLAQAGRRREAGDAIGAAITTWGVSQFLKVVFARRRPYHALKEFRLRVAQVTSESWPSSHPAVLLAFLTVASRDLDASGSEKTLLAALAGIVAVSRVYLGVHYPADVVGGLLLGRGIADVWSAAVSPLMLKRLPSVVVPATTEG